MDKPEFYNCMAIGIAYSGTTATGVTREVLLAIASYSNPEDRRCLRSVADIAARAGCSRRAVFTSIKWLRAHNELKMTPRHNKSGDRTSSEYVVTIPLPGGGAMAALPSELNALPGAQAIALGGAQAAAPFLKNLIKEQVIEDMPITPHGVKSAKQAISIADQEKKKAESPEKKEWPASDPRLEEFLAEYPRRGGTKADLETAWGNCNVTDGLFVTIMNKLKEAKASMDWGEQDGKFIPYPAKWLKEQGWLKQYRRKRLPL